MPEQALTITIKPAEASQLEVLEQEFSPDTLSKPHHKRYEVQQRGEGVYLIAWHGHTPVGHFLLRWSGPDDARVMKYIDVKHSAFLEAGATRVAYRRKGVATALIREAERVARAKGCMVANDKLPMDIILLLACFRPSCPARRLRFSRHLRPHSSSYSANSTNESRQSIREGLLLVRLEFCQQALMSFRQTPGQTRGSLVPCITQMQSEHPRIMKITHSLHPSSLLKLPDEATHRTFLEMQMLCQQLLRHRCLGGERHQRKHLGEREGEAGRHLVRPVQP